MDLAATPCAETGGRNPTKRDHPRATHAARGVTKQTNSSAGTSLRNGHKGTNRAPATLRDGPHLLHGSCPTDNQPKAVLGLRMTHFLKVRETREPEMLLAIAIAWQS